MPNETEYRVTPTPAGRDLGLPTGRWNPERDLKARYVAMVNEQHGATLLELHERPATRPPVADESEPDPNVLD